MRRWRYSISRIDAIILSPISSGADAILEPLGIAIKKYPADEKRVCWELSPWIVEQSLDRLGGKQLSVAEQKVVWEATRTPRKVTRPQGRSFVGV